MAKSKETQKRTSKCVKMFIQPDGSLSRQATPDTVGLRSTFVGYDPIDISRDDIGPNCQAASFWHGLSHKFGNSYSTSKSIEDAVEDFQTMAELLKMDNWVSERKGAGPRPSMLAAAVEAALIVQGEEVNDERRKGIVEKLKDADFRKGTLDNAAVRAEYETIRAAAAASRASNAAEAEGVSGADLSSF